MIKKSDIFNIVKTGLILFLITGIAAFVLSVVNSATEPIITENNREKREAAMKKVMPEADSFEENGIDCSGTEEKIGAVYAAKRSGEVIGYVVIAEPNGYNGAVTTVVGVDKAGTVTGVDITSQSETAGLGANCTKDEFKDSFKGKTDGITVVKSGAKNNQIDALTSATITSKAVVRGVNAAIVTAKMCEEAREK